MGECRYGKKHSFIEIFNGKDLEVAGRGAAEYDLVKFCEVCGIVEIRSLRGVLKRRLIPQIAKEVLAAEQLGRIRLLTLRGAVHFLSGE